MIERINPFCILVVDGAAAIRILVSHLLERENYLVITAENGQETLRLAQAHFRTTTTGPRRMTLRTNKGESY